MKILELARISFYVANGFIENDESFDVLEGYINYNYDVLKEFKGIVIANTYKNYNNELVTKNRNLWQKYFPNTVTIDIKENRGHSFGIADSENALIDYCKDLNIEWICKCSNDVTSETKILERKISGDSDLYYFNGISYEDLYLYKFDFEKLYEEHFYPQTNFYFLRIGKIDYLYEKNYVDETYAYRLKIQNYNNKIWEYIPGWSCENFLKRCVKRNNLKSEYILTKQEHINLCKIIEMYKIGDPSHKNVSICGVCHLQWPDEMILEC